MGTAFLAGVDVTALKKLNEFSRHRLKLLSESGYLFQTKNKNSILLSHYTHVQIKINLVLPRHRRVLYLDQ